MGKRPIYIKQLSLRKHACFEDIDISFAKDEDSPYQWTVLLGNNNTGKTNILKAIAGLDPVDFQSPQMQAKKAPYALYNGMLLHSVMQRRGRVSCLFFPLSDVMNWAYGPDGVRIYDTEEFGDFAIYGYGVSRYPASTSLGEKRGHDNVQTLFRQNEYLVNIEEWLMQLDYASKNEKSSANNRLYRIKEILCGKLFPEILDFKFESSDELHNYVLFQTKDGWFRYPDLGFGYQSMLSWVIDLCKKMFERYPDSENPLAEPAVVLVDEIDLHLHPQWQRGVISFLSEIFPKVQFIVTTHSPLVIQSVERINLYVLAREESMVRVKHYPDASFQGWTVEEIMSDLMGLKDDVRSDKYQELIGKLQVALQNRAKKEADAVYQKLLGILHPESIDRELFSMQIEGINDQVDVASQTERID